MIDKILASAVNKLITEITNMAKGPLKQALLKCLSGEAAERRERYAESISQVKTIWQIDKSVNVHEFYYPTTLEMQFGPFVVSSATELFKEKRALVIEGIAGQGKSIFLRYITTQILREGQLIPVFVQLRHISKSTNLEQLIKSAFTSLGIVDDKLVYEYFLRSGRAIFLLDGFDEIEETYKAETIRLVESYLQNYKNIQIAITSRPNSDIQHSIHFLVLKIKPLNDSDRTKLIEKLVDHKKTRGMILSSLSRKIKIAGVLTTPLLVTLLVITYKSESEIPDNLSDFYKSLFITLIKRHDKTKPGYIRERQTLLGNIEFEKVFENLCFIALNNYKVSMSEREFVDYGNMAMKAESLDGVSAQQLIEDITRITCLILLDGDKYYFLHKSIPEYFAAQKISEEQDLTIKEEFYSQLLATSIPENWHQTLYFLEEIDKYHFTCKLLIPMYAKTFKVSTDSPPNNPPKFTKESLIELFGKYATLSMNKYRDTYRGEINIDSKNWLINTHLKNSVHKTFKDYIEHCASDFLLDSLYRARKESNYLEFCFNEANIWTSFLTYVNSSSALIQSYQEIFRLKKQISHRKSNITPLLQLNLSPEK